MLEHKPSTPSPQIFDDDRASRYKEWQCRRSRDRQVKSGEVLTNRSSTHHVAGFTYSRLPLVQGALASIFLREALKVVHLRSTFIVPISLFNIRLDQGRFILPEGYGKLELNDIGHCVCLLICYQFGRLLRSDA
jgi:hypothetical protein